GAGCSGEPVEIARGVNVVVGEGCARGELHPGRFEPLKELIWARDTTERGNGAVDGWNFHAAMQAPHGSPPPSGFDLIFYIGFIGGDRDHLRALRRTQRLAQVTGGKQMVVQV